MRWSDRNDDDNLKALLRGEGGGPLGPALAELREKAPEAPDGLRERVRAIAAEEASAQDTARRPLLGRRFSFAHAGAAVAAVLVVAVAVPTIAAFTGDGGSPQASADEAAAEGKLDAVGPKSDAEALQPPPNAVGGNPAWRSAAPPAAPPPAENLGGAGAAAPLPPPRQRVQDYSARITLHVGDHDGLSDSVQAAIRTTRNLGGYVTYVDYGTSGSKDGDAELRVRVPVGRVQSAIARFSELGTILEQKTEIRDLQGQIDTITRDIQRRRDRIAKLEAELRDPTLTAAERDRLEARLVRAKRGLANAARARTSVIRQGSFAKLDLAFTTEERKDPAPPPGRIERALDDAAGILADELAVGIYILVAGAPFFLLAALAILAARSLRRAAATRVLERA